MARTPQVTRTIQTTKVTAMCVNVVEEKTFEEEYILGGTFKDEKTLLKTLEKQVNSDTVRVVHVKKTELLETLYGMTEQDFIKHASVLPSRTKSENTL